MIVCIAEKPSVARDIASILGANQRKDGYIEGNGYQVTWTFGHLCTLKEPHEYTEDWKAWRLGTLPMIPPRFGIRLISNPTYEKQFSIIEDLMQNASLIINCGDAGQEGELIQRWVIQKTGAKCPVKRLWISSLTEEAIREGFQKLKDESAFQLLYEAGLARAIGDWLLGINATRLYTQKYASGRQVLSIGRVQTPTLALIVNRYLEIENFKPEPYWELKTLYREVTFSASQGRFSTREEGEGFLERIKEHEFTVSSIQRKKGNEYPLRLFDLTSLQVECNKKFAYSADETLKTIQSLYEKKLTTYPRVDTTFLSDDIYPKCPKILSGLKEYSELVQSLNLSKLPKSKKVFDNSKVTDHHAIIPTGELPQNLSEAERNVYDLIVRRFIASFYPPCKVATTTVNGLVEKVKFKVNGKEILDPGWRVVYAVDEEDDKKESATLPDFKEGETGPHQPDLLEKWTTPPKLYTEATLLSAMETAGRLVDNDDLRDALKENGIGRPSTRAAIIETLFKRNYIKKEKKNLLPTPTGIDLIQVIKEDLLKSAELTGIWEKKLREIEKGKYEAQQFLEELKQMLHEIVHSVLSDNSNRMVTVQVAEEVKSPKKKPTGTTSPKKKTSKPKKSKEAVITEGQVCPLCKKGKVIKGNSAYGCSEWRNGCTFRSSFQ